MVFFEKNYIDPTGRQNFGDAPGQISKLILTLCHIVYETVYASSDAVNIFAVLEALFQFLVGVGVGTGGTGAGVCATNIQPAFIFCC